MRSIVERLYSVFVEFGMVLHGFTESVVIVACRYVPGEGQSETVDGGSE